MTQSNTQQPVEMDKKKIRAHIDSLARVVARILDEDVAVWKKKLTQGVRAKLGPGVL